jgi:glycine cleavage system transcriptional repressor
MTKVIISVLGKDRPGIVAAVSRVLFERDCNIENVSQTILQTEFAGIFIAGMPAGVTAENLQQGLTAGLADFKMYVQVKPLAENGSPAPPPVAEPFVITTSGPDAKGLVARITAVIARYQVNVTNLQAVFKGGSEPGDNIMIYEVDVPTHIDQQRFRQDLQDQAAALGLRLTIQHRDIFSAMNRI